MMGAPNTLAAWLQQDRAFSAPYVLLGTNSNSAMRFVLEQADLDPGDVITIGTWRFTYRVSQGSMPFASIVEEEGSEEMKTERISARGLYEALQLRQAKQPPPTEDTATVEIHDSELEDED